MESQLGLDAAARSGKRVIPVLLPGVDPAELPVQFDFLKLRTWVNMSQGFEEGAMDRLAAAIKDAPAI
jgi:hypothetical protein